MTFEMPTEAEPVRVVEGDALEVIPLLPNGSVHGVVTSPPYWDLRFGQPGIGSEATVEGYIESLRNVFGLLWHKVAKSGTCFLNLGDTFRNKRLQGVPWRVALALQSDGWVLRSEVVWEKDNHKPEKVKDRPTRSHEHVFLLTRRASGYFYDWRAESEPASGTDARPQFRRAKELAAGSGLTADHIAAIRAAGATDAGKSAVTQSGTGRNTATVSRLATEAKAALGGYYREFLLADRRNCRSVWNVSADRSSHSHTAPMPERLASKCVRLGCPAGGVVLDPFAGSGTTGVAAVSEGRRAILIEKDATHAETCRRRVAEALGMGVGSLLAAVPGLFDEPEPEEQP